MKQCVAIRIPHVPMSAKCDIDCYDLEEENESGLFSVFFHDKFMGMVKFNGYPTDINEKSYNFVPVDQIVKPFEVVDLWAEWCGAGNAKLPPGKLNW